MTNGHNATIYTLKYLLGAGNMRGTYMCGGTYRNECPRCTQNCESKNILLADSSESERPEKVLSTKCFETSKYEKKN